jgi:hypothetical protein
MVLAALGICYCGSIRGQSIALTLVIGLSLVQFVSYVHRSPAMDWQHAVRQIRAYRSSAEIAVAPARSANLIRYYLTSENGYHVVGLTDSASCTQSGILVVWNSGMVEALRKQARDCSAAFPHLLYQHRDFTVFAR